MLTPEYMAGVADAAEEVADKLHNDVMSRIIDRLMKRTDRGEEFYLTGTDKWNIETLQQAGFLYEDVLEEIQKKAGQTSAAVARAFKNAGVRTLENDQKIYDKMGVEPIDPLRSPQYMAMMETDYQLTNGSIKNLTQTTADCAQKTFIEECDNIYLSVTRGTDTLGHALFEAIDRISDADGLYITYPSGARATVETAVTRCVRTGVAQMSGRITEKRAEEVGCEHYLVSSHLGARPSHAVWQGQVYKIHGSDKKYKNFKETTGYGTGPGLCGWNCRHSFSPFFPEFMENNQKQYSVEENEEAYNKRQEEMAELRAQREKARKIRAFSEAREQTDDPELKALLSEAISKEKNKKNELTKTSSDGKISTSPTDEDVFSFATKEQYDVLRKKHSKNVSEADKKLIHNHTKKDGSPGGYVATHNYQTINSNLRNDGFTGNKLDADDLETIEALKRAINSNKLDNDYILTRYLNADYLSSRFGITYKLAEGKHAKTLDSGITKISNPFVVKKEIPRITEELKTMIGEKIEPDGAFISTSMIPDKNKMKDKAVRFDIKAPKGTNCYVVNNRKESECILGTDVDLIIEDVRWDDTERKWIFTLLVGG